MIISLNWLKKYIELGESTAELEKLLTFAGIEVEAVKELPALPQKRDKRQSGFCRGSSQN
jgi:hypothetical protein